eukprot:TRINITY_DN4153_c0_g1_i5.p1 TRINITY_DN4153_c0_g1~~TRINITY_DN4153_c0_g1_i5.p1  ORF type:complete len:282 (-),score=54.01 TRINITY_DN4153_c0_g1_i5:314-1159(-)
MVLRTFFVAIFFLSVSTQPTELFCYNPSQEQNPFQSRTEVDALKPLVEEGKLLFQQQIDGLSIEEAGQQLPELFNETVVVLIQDVAGTDFDTISPVDVTIATFEAIINTTGGVEIIDAMLEDPNNFASLFQLVLANFDVACTESPRVTLTSVGLSMLQYFQQEPFREEVVDIINTTAVVVSKAYGVQDEIVATLEPVITTLTQTEGAGDALASLLTVVGDEAVAFALSSALDASGFTTNPEDLAESLADFLIGLRDSLEIDNEDFISFMIDIFQNIVNALK